LSMKNSPMLRSVLPLITLLAIGPLAEAQYYYKDLVSNKQLLTEMAQLKEQKIRTISVKSFEDDGSPSDGFFCEKRISRNYGTVEMLTRSNVSGASDFTSTFNNKGFLTQTYDSSEISSNTTLYEYDESNRIKSISSTIRSNDDDFANEITEVHQYYYNDKGLPLKMIRVKNNSDSTVILFSLDEKTNVSIEKNSKTGDTYYYYYDTRNRITDVVRLNPYNQQMLPDYIFEYNSAGLIAQMTTTEEGGSYYYIWKYTYDNGLRIREKCFSKEKRLMGTIEYEYK
jgi:hypothetical protein